jgi:CHAT domain-containing protein
LLRDDEALVLFHGAPTHDNFPGETFGWVVTKTNSRWFRAALGPDAIADHVRALRCGLDYEGAWTVLRSQCPQLLRVEYTRADGQARKPLPFDLTRAHTLYRGLFGTIGDLIQGKQLLLVSSGPLTQLPFHVLVTAPPKIALPTSAAGYRGAAWFARRHAVAVLPAVSSLKALRPPRKTWASRAFVGFGDPLLDGDPEKYEEDADRARLAREARCPTTDHQLTTLLSGRRRGDRAVMQATDGLADLSDIRKWPPLPETADELCEVAQHFGVDPASHLHMGAAATESEVKRLSNSGELAKYQVVHFATHAAVSGEVEGISEPGLILTPPDKPSRNDDGFLAASEIARLKLDADWVILSACNTASGETRGAEALSGLARAFLYAGARSLLVSHWEVASESTVKLITAMARELKADRDISRAQALRLSMVAMIDKGRDFEAHPAFWAPFVLVGGAGP